MTPFAQILASLRTVRSNYINLTNLPNRYVKLFTMTDIFFVFIFRNRNERTPSRESANYRESNTSLHKSSISGNFKKISNKEFNTPHTLGEILLPYSSILCPEMEIGFLSILKIYLMTL